MSALARITESNCYTRAANEDYINGGPGTRTKYTYDANGNATTRGAAYGITWTSYNYPSGINGSVDSVSFYYGQNHQRYKTVYAGSIGTEFTYHVGKLLEKVANNGVLDYRHYIFAGGELVAIYSRMNSGTNTVHYILGDNQSSFASVLTSTGTLDVPESFTAYGNRRSGETWSGAPSGPDETAINSVSRWGYTGQTMLGVSLGLNHMNGRVQDAITGRFLSPDPYVPDLGSTQSYNRYSYVNNNPLTFIDPTGFDVDCPTGIQDACNGFVVTGNRDGDGGGDGGGPGQTGGNPPGGGRDGGGGPPLLPPPPIVVIPPVLPQSPNPCPGANDPASAFRDSAPNNPSLGYTPDNVLPSNAQQVTAPDGTVFYAPPKADFAAVYTYGTSLASIPSPLNTGGLQYVSGFGGLFDFQRGNNQFNSSYAYASNYAIGILAYAANISLSYTQFVAGLVKLVSGGQGFPSASDARAQGYLAAQSGACLHP